ncbi:hypothetical protein [Luedemannella helvata]|uniref:hypothetical protein n=1 Tax=Luedemannella helvata TaxID=349315 RepID=UPI0031E10B85
MVSDFDHHDWDGAPPEGGFVQVRVDLDGVKGFGSFVHDETVRNLDPFAQRIARACDDDTVAFGNRRAFPALYEARADYQASLHQAISNLREFVAASRILVGAVDKVVEQYGSTDALSAKAVDKILGDAVAQAALERKAHDEMVRIASAHTSLPTSVTKWGEPR